MSERLYITKDPTLEFVYALRFVAHISEIDIKDILYHYEIYTAMHKRGVYPFHGDGIVDKDGKGIIFVGAKNTGKSTISSAVAERLGFPYFIGDAYRDNKGFGEDIGVVIAKDDSMTVFPISLTPENRDLYYNGVDVAYIFYLRREESPSSSADDLAKLAQVYSYLTNDINEEQVVKSLSDHADLLMKKAVHLRIKHRRLINAEGKLEDTIAIVENALKNR